MNSLQGKVAVVTGASRGIGRAIALRLAREGAFVAVHFGRREELAEEVVRHIQQQGGLAFKIGADISQLSGIHDLYRSLDDTLQKHTGNNRFDILVNNAGIGQILSLEEATEESFDEVMSINVKGPFSSFNKRCRD